jgi:hypothetical protein
MGKRAGTVGAIAVLSLLLLTGCQALKPAGFTQADARSDTARWTSDAVGALGAARFGSPPTNTKADGYETCRTDTSFFTTTSEWRTITDLGVAVSKQDAATASISAAFVRAGWVASIADGVHSLKGPHGAKRMGVIRIESGGGAELTIIVISPCYS